MTDRRPAAMHSEHRRHVDATPEAVWRTLEQVERYRVWWPWLRRFDGRTLATGERWTCTVRSALRYPVRFSVDLQEVVAEARVGALVDGDVAGRAVLDLVPQGRGTDLVLVADLHAAHPWLQRLERWARPIARFGHDRIIERALAELASRVR